MPKTILVRDRKLIDIMRVRHERRFIESAPVRFGRDVRTNHRKKPGGFFL